jgi:hypothetical protein
MRGRAEQVLDFDDPAAPNGSLATPSAAFGQLLAAAFDDAMPASSLCAAELTVGFRLGAAARARRVNDGGRRNLPFSGRPNE